MRQLPVADPGTPDLRSAHHFFMWLMKQQRASVLLGIVWGCAWMVAQALVPAVIGSAIDALAGRRTGAFTFDCLAVLGLGVLTALAGVLRHRRVVMNFLDAAYRIIQLVTAKSAALGNTLAKLITTGEVVSVGTADVDAIGSGVDVTGRGSGAVVALIVVAAILLARSLPLGLIVLIGGPIMTAVVGVLLKPLHHRQQRYRDQQGALATRAADIVAGLRVLRGIGGEPAFRTRYRDQSQQLRFSGVHVARTESFLDAAEVLLPGLFVTAATWIAAHYALHKVITPGQLVTFYAYTSFLAVPLATLTEAADRIVRSQVAAGRVIAILRLRPEVADPEQPSAEPLPGATLIDPESGLTVPPATLLALASDDPAAMARLADRIGGYIPDAGPRLDDVPLASLPVASVRSRILVAANDAHIFAGPLREQVSGASLKPEQAVLAAVSTASAGDVLEAVGLDGALAARGRTLSGGQAQRIRLVRALLADPEILILIEPTSAVDAHTEAAIAASLRTARSGRSTVVVSNSPLLLDQADQVAFIVDGKVAALSTHRELLVTNEAYVAAVARAGEL
ncbi:MAG TPA: ABC transporter ATP-binding protein [Streptosporangiaceae bacterium]|jgi:ABC-type multidrug transport system fused ATPase/permease subunit